MSYLHLSIEQREIIWVMRCAGYSFRVIAETIHVNKSTVSREIKRNGGIEKYLPCKAHINYFQKRQNCRPKKILEDKELFNYVKERFLNEQWSPEQIAERKNKEKGNHVISYITIYRAIYDGLFDEEAKTHSKVGAAYKLRRKGKSLKGKYGKKKRGGIKISNKLEDRPKEADSRERIGDWEADTVIGKKGKACLVTLDDRKSRFLVANKAEDKSAPAVTKKMIEGLKGKKCLTITPDRGTEFANHSEVTKELGGVPFYFPQPHQPWQRGTNENTNGLLREYFPKGKDISEFSDEYIQAVIEKINKRPRKCLDWKTPYEVFYDLVLHLT